MGFVSVTKGERFSIGFEDSMLGGARSSVKLRLTALAIGAAMREAVRDDTPGGGDNFLRSPSERCTIG